MRRRRLHLYLSPYAVTPTTLITILSAPFSSNLRYKYIHFRRILGLIEYFHLPSCRSKWPNRISFKLWIQLILISFSGYVDSLHFLAFWWILWDFFSNILWGKNKTLLDLSTINFRESINFDFPCNVLATQQGEMGYTYYFCIFLHPSKIASIFT